ncbi:hypothetical protein ACFLUA_03695 [Chloroflexota bacterium]
MRDYLRMRAEAQTNQYQSRGALRDIQFNKLTALLEHTYYIVPFYKDSFKQTGVTPKEFRTWDDYKKNPILTTNQIRDDPDSFEILIVTDTEEEALDAERFIQARIHNYLGAVDVCVRYVPAIPTEATENLRIDRSEVEWNDLL